MEKNRMIDSQEEYTQQARFKTTQEEQEQIKQALYGNK